LWGESIYEGLGADHLPPIGSFRGIALETTFKHGCLPGKSVREPIDACDANHSVRREVPNALIEGIPVAAIVIREFKGLGEKCEQLFLGSDSADIKIYGHGLLRGT
jgi:hypothetical protein